MEKCVSSTLPKEVKGEIEQHDNSNMNGSMDKSLKQGYTPPRVLQATEVWVEQSIMAESVVQPSTQIDVAGQTIQADGFIDAPSDATFNHTWE